MNFRKNWRHLKLWLVSLGRAYDFFSYKIGIMIPVLESQYMVAAIVSVSSVFPTAPLAPAGATVWSGTEGLWETCADQPGNQKMKRQSVYWPLSAIALPS